MIAVVLQHFQMLLEASLICCCGRSQDFKQSVSNIFDVICTVREAQDWICKALTLPDNICQRTCFKQAQHFLFKITSLFFKGHKLRIVILYPLKSRSFLYLCTTNLVQHIALQHFHHTSISRTLYFRLKCRTFNNKKKEVQIAIIRVHEFRKTWKP